MNKLIALLEELNSSRDYWILATTRRNIDDVQIARGSDKMKRYVYEIAILSDREPGADNLRDAILVEWGIHAEDSDRVLVRHIRTEEADRAE